MSVETAPLSVTKVYGSIGNTAVYTDDRFKYVARRDRDSWDHNPIVHLEIPPYVEARKREFQQALRITREEHSAGVGVLAGTDSGGVPYLYYGSSLHDELALLVPTSPARPEDFPVSGDRDVEFHPPERRFRETANELRRVPPGTAAGTPSRSVGQPGRRKWRCPRWHSDIPILRAGPSSGGTDRKRACTQVR
jgi:hypothetical protein